MGAFDGAYRWNGLRHASTSTRNAQERSGGRESDLQTTYSVKVLQQPGAGVPPIVNNLQSLALQPGALFQSTKVQPSTLTLIADLDSTTLVGLHSKRQDFFDLIKPDRTRDNQAFTLAYTGAHATRRAYGRWRYNAGFELGEIGGNLAFVEDGARRAVQLINTDPFWVEDNQEVASLDFTDSLASNNYGAVRVNGDWQNLGTGFNGQVLAIAIDEVRGRVYFGGAFTTANGVTVNRIGYWNGSTFVAMDAGTNNIVNAIAIAPNGDVWVGGSFTTVGSGAAACKGLARWNLSAGTWTAFNPSTASFNSVNALAIDVNGLVYIGGSFTDWNGAAAGDFLVSYDGSTYGNTPTLNNTVYALAVGIDGTTIYAGGDFTTTPTRIGSWNGSTWTTLGSGADGRVSSLAVDAAGNLYVGGLFTSTPVSSEIAKWNGSAWSALGSGISGGTCYVIHIGPDGRLWAGGDFTSAGGLSIADRMAVWNGSTWTHPDIDFPGSPQVRAIEVAINGDVYVGTDTTGTATTSGITTVTNSGTTEAYPIITLIGPSSASCVLQWIENQSTGQRLYFNLTVQAGETITYDVFAGTLVSDWRGLIYDQPLSGSDDFVLLPGANTVAAFITGTTTGVTLQARWTPRHWSVDGVAA